MLIPALLVGLVALIGRAEGRFGCQLFLEEPIVLCPLTGFLLGDPITGLLIGGTLQLVFLGNMGIGAATPADQVLGSVLATAIAILSNQGMEIAVALAVPVAALGQALVILVRTTFNVYFVKKARNYASEGDPAGVTRMQILTGIVYCIITAFVPAFFAILAGVPAVQGLLDMLPEVITSGLKAASKMLPGLGFAILFTQMYQKKYLVFFALGFVIVAYLGMDTVGLAALAVCVAVIFSLLYNQKPEESEEV